MVAGNEEGRPYIEGSMRDNSGGNANLMNAPMGGGHGSMGGSVTVKEDSHSVPQTPNVSQSIPQTPYTPNPQTPSGL